MSTDQLRASHVAQAFPLADDYEPTLKDVAGQLSALSQQVTETTQVQLRLGRQFGELASHVNDRIGAVHADVALLRAAVTGSDHDIDLLQTQVVKDIGPRVTAVEKVTTKQHLARATVYGVPVATVLGIVFQVLQTRWPELAKFMKGIFEASGAVQ